MMQMSNGRFCWLDLAASHSARAQTFYQRMFGWTAREQHANGGRFTLLNLAGRDVGSLYQLNRRLLEAGLSSHWTPYVCVTSADDASRRAVSCGGETLVRPFDVHGVARIALIRDAVGAQIGLWETVSDKETGDG